MQWMHYIPKSEKSHKDFTENEKIFVKLVILLKIFLRL